MRYTEMIDFMYERLVPIYLWKHGKAFHNENTTVPNNTARHNTGHSIDEMITVRK